MEIRKKLKIIIKKINFMVLKTLKIYLMMMMMMIFMKEVNICLMKK